MSTFDPAELLGSLAAAGVEAVVIGGLAVAAHGHVRATRDLDIVPSATAENLERLARLLRDLGAEQWGTGDFHSSEFPYDPLDPEQLAAGGNFVLDTRFGRLDIMQWVPGIDEDDAFAVLRADAIPVDVSGVPMLVCSREHLIALKRAAGRPQDLQDLRELGEDV